MRRWVQTQYAGDERPYSFDMSDMASDESTTVSTITASSVCDVPCTISGESVTNGVWAGDVLTETPGRAMVKLLATFANSKTRVRVFEIEVKGPVVRQFSGIDGFSIATG